jgi:hypothetical protein
VADKDRKTNREGPEVIEADPKGEWWSEPKDFDPWFDPDTSGEFEAVEEHILSPVTSSPVPLSPSMLTNDRLGRIKESHTLLQQFTPKELKILLNLKRNTSPKAWTLREDLVVLTLPASNREVAQLLQDRNKEAVKKRLQLLKSKGLSKRLLEASAAAM